MRNRHALVGAVGLLTLTASVLAHDGDVGIRVNNGRLETVLATGEPPSQSFGTEVERVFAVEWAFNALTNDVRIDEPGLASADPALLGRTLGVNIRAALRRWGGPGVVPPATTSISSGTVVSTRTKVPSSSTPSSTVSLPTTTGKNPLSITTVNGPPVSGSQTSMPVFTSGHAPPPPPPPPLLHPPIAKNASANTRKADKVLLIIAIPPLLTCLLT